MTLISYLLSQANFKTPPVPCSIYSPIKTNKIGSEKITPNLSINWKSICLSVSVSIIAALSTKYWDFQTGKKIKNTNQSLYSSHICSSLPHSFPFVIITEGINQTKQRPFFCCETQLDNCCHSIPGRINSSTTRIHQYID